MIRFTVMSVFSNELADLLKKGDILLIKEAFVKFYKNELRLRLYGQELGYIFKIDEFCLRFNDEVNISTKYKMEANTSHSVIKKEPAADRQSIQKSKRKINFSPNYFDAYKKPPTIESTWKVDNEPTVDNELTVVTAKERKQSSPKKATSRISMNERMEHLKQRFR
jgi:hypothetical protein